LQAARQIRQRHRLLLTCRKVLHLGHALRNVIVANDHRGPRADPVRGPQW